MVLTQDPSTNNATAAAAAAGLEDYDFMGQCDDLFALRRLMRKPGTEVVSDLPCNVRREGG